MGKLAQPIAMANSPWDNLPCQLDELAHSGSYEFYFVMGFVASEHPDYPEYAWVKLLLFYLVLICITLNNCLINRCLLK